ncbi:MAG: triose-phosphate isomerase [Candidatus Latescibacterota bacterium]|nr:MAG: triose-phosphate isomerase [Candidatus Latescibacterota bacterium]
MSRAKLVAANWKMQKSIAGARSFSERLVAGAADDVACEIVLFPPFFALPFAAEKLKGTSIAVGAQDLFWEKEGAYTGEISAGMIVEAGGTFVIVGHSERRHVIGETNEVIAKKLKAAIEAGLTPVFCVGEKISHREAGEAEQFVGEQLESALSQLSASDLERIIIAYEPVWAIGTGKTATPEDAVEMHRFIRGCLSSRFGSDLSERTRILYGGSVKPENAADLLREKEIDGALVGGASLDVDSFIEIASAAP